MRNRKAVVMICAAPSLDTKLYIINNKYIYHMLYILFPYKIIVSIVIGAHLRWRGRPLLACSLRPPITLRSKYTKPVLFTSRGQRATAPGVAPSQWNVDSRSSTAALRERGVEGAVGPVGRLRSPSFGPVAFVAQTHASTRIRTEYIAQRFGLWATQMNACLRRTNPRGLDSATPATSFAASRNDLDYEVRKSGKF